MSHDPYIPPAADLRGPEVKPAQAPKKPWSAWLLQIVGLATLAMFMYGVERAVSITLREGLQQPLGYFLFGLAWRLALAAAALFAILGTQRRAQYGRVLGLIFIAALLAMGVYAQLVKTGSLVAVTTDDAERVGEIVGRFLGVGIFVAWFYAFGFSEKARSYFQRD